MAIRALLFRAQVPSVDGGMALTAITVKSFVNTAPDVFLAIESYTNNLIMLPLADIITIKIFF